MRRARPTYKSPLGLVVDEKGERAYVALHTAGAVAVVDLKAGKVLKEIHVGNGPFDLAIRNNTLVVTCSDDDQLVLVDLAQTRTIKSIPVGQSPQFLAWSADKTELIVDCPDVERTYGLNWKTKQVKQGPWVGGAIQWSKTRQFGIQSVGSRANHELPTTQIAQGWIFLNALEWWRGYGLSGYPIVVDEPECGYADLSDAVAMEEEGKVLVSSAGATPSWSWTRRKGAN